MPIVLAGTCFHWADTDVSHCGPELTIEEWKELHRQKKHSKKINRAG
jgi:hypothetical protein